MGSEVIHQKSVPSSKSTVPSLYVLHLHAEKDGETVCLELTTVNCRKREERLGDLLQKCAGPKSGADGSWKLVVPSVKVQRGDPGAMAVPSPKVATAANSPPMLRALSTRTYNGAARTVGWLVDALRKQGLFDLHCKTQLAKELKLGFGQAVNPEAAPAAGSGVKRARANHIFLLQQEELQRQSKKPRIVDI